MLEGFRNRLAEGFAVLAQRVSTEPKYLDQNRVAGRSMTSAGVRITPDNAITIAAVWACIRYLSQTVGVLPWHVMKLGDKGAEVQLRNPIDYLLHDRPSLEWSSFQFRETLTHWALRWGNGWAEIERDTVGRPLGMWPLHPERCQLCRDPDTGELYLEVSNGAGPKIEIPYADVFHIRGFGEGVLGVNVIQYAAESLGWAKAAQIYGSAFFGNGFTPSVIVKNKKPLSPPGLKKQRAEFDALYKGPTKSHRSAHIDNDAEVEKLSLNAEETQLILVHQHLVEEVCRWFGVPPHKVMHMLRATFSNIEHQSIEVVVDSITPWTKRFEDEANFKLFGQNRRGLFTKINMNALLKGDMKARMEFYKGMQFVGAYSPNKILTLEDENTLGPIGDIHVMQQQMVPLEFIAKGPVKPASAASAAPAPANYLENDADRLAREAFQQFLLPAPEHV